MREEAPALKHEGIREVSEKDNRMTAMETDLGHSKMLVIIVIKYLFRQAQEMGVNKVIICMGC